jgi:glycerophosphoryl diester phosphodiesterase
MFALQALLGLPPEPWVVGHRGAEDGFPENSVESLRLAHAEGAHLAELDLQLTADGHLVVVHDWTLDRLAGTDLAVERAPLSALRDLRLLPCRPGGPRPPIPTLPEVLAALPAGFPLDLELKRRRAGRRRLARALTAAVHGRARLLVSSFDWLLLRECRRLDPELPLAPLAEGSGEGLLGAADELSAVGVGCDEAAATDSLVVASRAAGRPVLVFTVDEPAVATRLFRRGISGVFSNRPGVLLRALGR